MGYVVLGKARKGRTFGVHPDSIASRALQRHTGDVLHKHPQTFLVLFSVLERCPDPEAPKVLPYLSRQDEGLKIVEHVVCS